MGFNSAFKGLIEVSVEKWKIAPVTNTGLSLRKVSWTEKDSSSAL